MPSFGALRGFGGSDRPPSGYDLATLASDLPTMLVNNGAEPAEVGRLPRDPELLSYALAARCALTLAQRQQDLAQVVAFKPHLIRGGSGAALDLHKEFACGFLLAHLDSAYIVVKQV